MPSKPETAQATPVTAPLQRPAIMLSLLAGVVLASAIAFGTASYFGNDAPVDYSDAIGALEQKIAQQQQGLSDAEILIGELRASLAATGDTQAGMIGPIEEMSRTLVAIEARLLALEKRPLAKAGGLTQEAAEAFERDMAEMRDLLAAQRAGIEKLAADVTQKIVLAAQRAETLDESAKTQASAASLRSAMAQLQMALDGGGAYEAALGDLLAGGVDIHPALSKFAKTGVPTLAHLQQNFPDAARAALKAVSDVENGADTLGKLGSFLRAQTGARSLEPRDGNDPDAVLSRVEAALKAGDLDVALVMTGALPQAARAAMSGWIDAARSRNGAVQALRRLNQDISSN